MLTLATALSSTSTSGLGLFLQLLVNGVTTGAMYALVALGYTMVYGIVELINFAHGDVFMWATVVMLIVTDIFHLTTPPGNFFAVIGLLLLLMIIGMVISGTINFGLELTLYRRLRKAPRVAPLIAAVGASFILETIVQIWRGTASVSFPSIFPNSQFTIGSVTIQGLDIFIVIVALGLMFALDRFIQQTKLGRAMRATAQDPEAASLMGVNVNRTISVTFIIGGALAGAAALFYVLSIGQVWYFTGFQLGLIAFTAAVLGGIGNIYGAVVGGFLIGIIQSLAIGYISNGSSWSLAVVFAILVLILVVRPSGLLGQQVPDKV